MFREASRLVRDLRRDGYQVVPTNKGHFRVMLPTGATLAVFSSTPSNQNFRNRVMADLKRAQKVLDSGTEVC